MSYCDSHNNCLPPWLGTWVPLITYGATCLSYLLSMLDSLQPETTAEKIETASVCWSNFMVRTVSLVLALSCLGWLWTGVLVSVVLSLDGLYLSLSSNIPARFSLASSWLVSLTTASLVVENISLRERGRDTHRDRREKERIQRSLSTLSLLNLGLFSAFTTLFCLMINYDRVRTNSNNILANLQLLPTFLYIFLPLTVINLLSSLLIIFLPAFSPGKMFQVLSSVLNILLLLATIVLPIISGVLLVPHSPRDVFILAKVRDSLSIYTATSSFNVTWNVADVWSYDKEKDSLSFQSLQLMLGETNNNNNKPEERRLILSLKLTDHDREEVLTAGALYITTKINPIDWNAEPFRSTYYQEQGRKTSSCE